MFRFLLLSLSSHDGMQALKLSACGMVAFLAQASPLDDYSKLGITGLSLAVAIWLTKQWLNERTLRDADRDKRDVERKEEREKYEAALKLIHEKNSISQNEFREILRELVDVNKEQTMYYKTLVRSVLDEKINGKKPNLP